MYCNDISDSLKTFYKTLWTVFVVIIILAFASPITRHHTHHTTKQIKIRLAPYFHFCDGRIVGIVDKDFGQ